MRRPTLALLAGAVAVLTGCGSTVQLGPQGQQHTAGLSVPTTGTGANGGLTGPAPAGTGGNAALPGVAGTDTTSGGSGFTSGGSSGVAPGTTSSGGRTSTGGTTTGAGRITGPVQIGFLNTKTGNASSFGVNVGQTYQPSDIFKALVKALNAHGGLAGRPIVPIVADTDTASPDWNTDYQAACAKFTQDNHASAVIGYSFDFNESFESCLSRAGVLHLDGGYSVGDVASFAQYPYLVSTTAPTSDRRYLLQVSAAVSSGLLTPKNKLGLLLDNCPFDQRAYRRTLFPYIRQHHLNVAATATGDCVSGANGDGNAAAQIQAAELSFRSKGVDRVFLEGVPLVIFAQEAQQQHWFPKYLVTSATGGGAVEPNIPAQQAANVHGAGWMPEVDVDPSNQPPKTAAQKRCLSLLLSEGIKPSQYNDFVSAYTTCDGLFLYAAALSLTRGDSAAAAAVGAITRLGTSYSAVSTYDGATYYKPTHRDAPAEYRLWSWVNGCSCFRYHGQPLRMP
ncbi:MAG: ABC transporter substrate-binding protein [Frankiales bacterium]|nr:ABC transporter substrate-binding protein [Frankiales bacterium]